uniref:Uncharacterized protein n=1 Tax=Arundo donax TaxID=35708 RepID=A0A0A9GIV6_ARUDO
MVDDFSGKGALLSAMISTASAMDLA